MITWKNCWWPGQFNRWKFSITIFNHKSLIKRKYIQIIRRRVHFKWSQICNTLGWLKGAKADWVRFDMVFVPDFRVTNWIHEPIRSISKIDFIPYCWLKIDPDSKFPRVNKISWNYFFFQFYIIIILNYLQMRWKKLVVWFNVLHRKGNQDFKLISFLF